MSQAAPSPAAPPVSRDDLLLDWTRIAAGLLFAAGMLVLFFRKSEGVAGGDDWAAFPLLLVVAIPCALLFGAALSEHAPGTAIRSWQAVYLVFAVIFVPIVLFQFLDMIGGDTNAGLNVTWIFALTAAVAMGSSLRTDALYQALLAGLALITAWLFLWNEILDDPSISNFRWLLVVIAAILLAAALALRTAARRQGDELVTAAGLAGVAAGSLGAIQVAGIALAAPLQELEGVGGTSAFWELFLLAVSVALVAYAASARVRGPAYVGGFGLFALIIILGVELGALAENETPDHELVGWPLLLVVLGLAAYGFSVARATGGGGGDGRGAVATGAPGTPGAAGGAQPGGLIEQWRQQPPQAAPPQQPSPPPDQPPPGQPPG